MMVQITSIDDCSGYTVSVQRTLTVYPKLCLFNHRHRPERPGLRLSGRPVVERE